MLEEAGLYQTGLWAAFVRVSPIGDYRRDLRAALGLSMFANVHRDTAKRPEPFLPRDFMLFLERTAQPAAQDALAPSLRAALAGMDGGRKGADLKAWRAARRRAIGGRRRR